MKKKNKPYWEMDTDELAEATKEFDREFVADEFREPTARERSAMQRHLFNHPASPAAKFDGPGIEQQDVARLTTALGRVFRLMSDGWWRTLRDIAEECETSEAGASARLRDLRKLKFGGYKVDRRRVKGGLFEYRLTTE